MSKSTISTFELFEMIPDQETARAYLETRLWPEGARCPVCASGERITTRKGGYYRCNACKEDFTVRTGTIFERSHVPLHKWIYAMYLLVTARKGISSLQLAKQIGVTQKTAWFILHRLREACGNDATMLAGIVECDETYVGGKESNRHEGKRKSLGRSGRNGRRRPRPMGSNPYLIEGPAIISFSMGRTSGYMLKQIIDAYGGTLPDNVHVVTSNTGKEREESLRFGHECASRWGFDWHLIEYRDDAIGAERVGLNSAARDGEPFTALILKKGYVPNRGGPYCSIELKARTTRDYVRATWGWKNWKAVLGLRHDEQHRVLGAIGRNHSGKDPWRNVMPLDTAKVSKRDIAAFWRVQDFDLGLLNYQGNCTRCWKKSESKRRFIIRDEQEGRAIADPWWAEMEAATGSTFDLKLSHLDLERQVHDEPMMPLDEPDFAEADEECGFTCFISDADQAEAA